jgi:hypothetical protein
MVLNATWARTADVRSPHDTLASNTALGDTDPGRSNPAMPRHEAQWTPTIRVKEAQWSDSVAIALLDLCVSIEEQLDVHSADPTIVVTSRPSSRRTLGSLRHR